MLPKVTILTIILSSLLLEISASRNQTNEDGKLKLLSRKRRYIAFPEGSSFSVAVCTTVGMIGNPSLNYMSYAMNWGVAYDLPNETWILTHGDALREKVTGESEDEDVEKTKIKRLFRRDLYKKVALTIDGMGFDGKQCILRALCESSRRFESKSVNMLEELIRRIFRFPRIKSFLISHHEEHDYDMALRHGKKDDCASIYSKCHFSVLDLALGKYSYASGLINKRNLKLV